MRARARRGQPRSAPRRLGPDEGGLGSLLAFEAIFVAVLLMLSIVAVQSMEHGRSQPSLAAREALEQNVADLLQHLGAMPDDDYGDRMTRMVVELINGNDTATRNLLKRTVSDQALFSVTLHNSRGGSMLLWRDREPTGEQVGRVAKWIPQPDTAFIVPDYDYFDGDTMGFSAQVMALRNGFPINDRDIPIEVEVKTDDGITYKQNVGVRFGEQQVTMGLVDGANVRSYWSSTDTIEFTLRISSGQAIPLGTLLEVHVPNRWLNVSTDSSPSWSDVNATQDADAWRIRARVNTSSPVLDFTFKGNRPGGDGATAFDLGSATLDNGSLGRADFVWRGLGTTETLASPFPRSTALAIPPTLRSGEAAAWGITFSNAQDTSTVRDLILGTCLSGCLNVTNVTLRQPQGLAIFSAADAGWTVSADQAKLFWTGNVELERDEAKEFRVNVTPATRTGGTPFTPSPMLTFPKNSYTLNMTQMVDNATWQGRSPAYFTNHTATIPGYPAMGGAHDVCVKTTIDARLHQACSNYTITTLTTMTSHMGEIVQGRALSQLTATNGSNYQPGEWLAVKADFTKLIEGLSSTIDFRNPGDTHCNVYYPWIPRNSHPDKWPLLFRNTTSSQVTNTSFQLPKGVPYGAYLVTCEKGLDFTGGTDTDQVVRKGTWVTVGMDGLTAPTVFYEIEINAWLPDWG